MPGEFEFLSSTDKPALLAIARPETLARCRATLSDAGYKVHSANNGDDFVTRFAQVQYEVVMLDEAFDPAESGENRALKALQVMPMSQRRHATSFLISPQFQTMHKMQAFQQSVHAVINPADLANLPQILQQVVADSQLFLAAFRDAQSRMAQNAG